MNAQAVPGAERRHAGAVHQGKAVRHGKRHADFRRRRPDQPPPLFPSKAGLPGNPEPAGPPQKWRRNGCAQLSIPRGYVPPTSRGGRLRTGSFQNQQSILHAADYTESSGAHKTFFPPVPGRSNLSSAFLQKPPMLVPHLPTACPRHPNTHRRARTGAESAETARSRAPRQAWAT